MTPCILKSKLKAHSNAKSNLNFTNISRQFRLKFSVHFICALVLLYHLNTREFAAILMIQNSRSVQKDRTRLNVMFVNKQDFSK